jgi:hypothetical protein
MAKQKVEMSPYLQAILRHLQGELVEIYCGDTRTTLSFSDFSVSQKSVIRGRIQDAMGDCLIVECEKNGFRNNIYINAWQIATITPMNGSLASKDMYQDEEDFGLFRKTK